MKYYKALWGKSLKRISAISTAIVLAPVIIGLLPIPAAAWFPPALSITLIALLLIVMLFIVRGYEITDTSIKIHRPLWKTTLDLGKFDSAEFSPHAMKSSYRLFGNGGFYSWTGWFRNQPLGTYRAFVTDRENTVVLRFGAKNIVISPASPEEFTKELQLHPLTQSNPHPASSTDH